MPPGDASGASCTPPTPAARAAAAVVGPIQTTCAEGGTGVPSGVRSAVNARTDELLFTAPLYRVRQGVRVVLTHQRPPEPVSKRRPLRRAKSRQMPVLLKMLLPRARQTMGRPSVPH